MWTAYQYLQQVKPRASKYTIVHIASVQRYHNLKPKGTIVDILT